MILSNVEVLKALNEGRLVIEPRPDISSYDTHTVDLTLADDISVPRGGAFNVDFSDGGSAIELMTKFCDTTMITKTQPYKLYPNKFILAMTKEHISLPIPMQGETCLCARIEGKSSRARFGMLVHFTAPTVHPDWKGRLALEIINLGPACISLNPGMKIAQLIIEEVKGIPTKNPSQFQEQKSATG